MIESRSVFQVLLVVAAALGEGCNQARVAEAGSAPAPAPAAEPSRPRLIRATGAIRAVRVYNVQVPRLEAQGGRVTLVRLAPNGAKVAKDDVLAEFDRTKYLDDALEAQARYEDLTHQVRQKEAQNKSDAEKRLTEVKQAEADLEKAQLQLRKGPILSEIDRLKNQARAEGARARVQRLQESHQARSKADAAALRILELQTARQKVAWERATSNAGRLLMRAPLAGMVALENIWRGGSMGNAQEGDQLWPGQPLLKIFDPSEMLVYTTLNEPDDASMTPGARALVQLDAYPDAKFEGRFESISPVANSAIGSPIKYFTAIFRLTQSDPRLLPDLSAAVVIRPEGKAP